MLAMEDLLSFGAESGGLKTEEMTSGATKDFPLFALQGRGDYFIGNVFCETEN